jgi:quercetin dioxygenase-like cupin family protein
MTFLDRLLKRGKPERRVKDNVFGTAILLETVDNYQALDEDGDKPRGEIMTESASKLTIAGAAPQNLAEMTDYQQGSVVSRTLLQNESGTLTVFSFDEGQALSEHTVPFNAFAQVLDGQAEITIGGNPCLVNAGEIVLMPGGISHKVRAVKRFKMLLTMFKTKVA